MTAATADAPAVAVQPRTARPQSWAPSQQPSDDAVHRSTITLSPVLRWGLVALAVLAMLMMLTWPLGYDQGVFASNGDIVARGGAPYRDAWDVKGPLVFYWAAATQLLFGRHAWGMRLVDVGIALATAWMLWRRLRTVASPNTAVIAAVLWPVLVAAQTFQNTAQFDLWIGSAMLGVTLLVTRDEGYRPRDLLLAGGLVGLASLVKPIFPVFLAVPGVVVLMRRRGAVAAVVRDLTLLVGGWLVPVAVVLVALWAQGALREAWNVHILYNLRVYAPNSQNSAFPSPSPTKARVKGLLAYLAQVQIAILLAPAAAGAVALWRKHPPLAAAVLVWVLGGVGLVVLQNKFWVYQWEILFAGLFLLVAAGVSDVASRTRTSSTPRAAGVMAITTAVVAFAVSAAPIPGDLTHWLRYVGGRESARAYDNRYAIYSEINPADEEAAAAYLRANTPPGAPFANWTLHGGLAFLAGRPNVTRFHNKRELTKTVQHPMTRAYRREYLERVRTLRPTYIAVDSLGDVSKEMADQHQVPSEPRVLEREFPELAALIAQRYDLVAHAGEIALYRLRPAPSSGPPAAATTAVH